MNRFLLPCAALLVAGTLATSTRADVAIWTGSTSWIDQASATAQAQICAARLEAAGIPVVLFSDATEETLLAEWVDSATDDGNLDFLILFGYFPPSLYPSANAMPDGSIAELFIESTDGDAIINHADWMFYVSSANNGAAGLQNMMDIPGITMAGFDNTQMLVTDEGREIAPNLRDFLTDRPLHLDGLNGEWVVEAALAQSADGTLADPVIVRDGNRGRVIPILQANAQPDPKGAVAAEVIAWLLDEPLEPTEVALSGFATTVAGTPAKLSVTLQDEAGIPTGNMDAVVDLETDSPSGAFDTVRDGSFDGTVTSVTVPAGRAATVYYRDSSAGTVTLSASASGTPDVTGAEMELSVLEDLSGMQGEVAIFTGTNNWITKGAADAQAQICVDKLDILGISNIWFQEPADEDLLADWVTDATENGELDVLILYGYFPPTIYPQGNAMPDDSLAELFIESTDGDVIINHADWMFYVNLVANNGAAGLQNMMDIPGVTMAGYDNTQMLVTDEGTAIAPSLVDFLTDRPLHLETLDGEWFVEAALAQSAGGTVADPVVVRDGNRGRLIPMFQAADQDDPKGAVAAEVIAWLYGLDLGDPTQIEVKGKSEVAYAGQALRLTAEVQDFAGSPSAVATPVTVTLQTDSATGAFDTAADGPFDGTITAVTIAAGTPSAEFYYRDTTAGTPVVTASAAALSSGSLELTILEKTHAPPGEVAIWTGTTNWIDKAAADAQAQICAGRLSSAGVSTVWFADPLDDTLLADWMAEVTGNGQLDVLILYGYFPSAIYPGGNAMPDGSIAELFIESTDGDAIINHGDWMFYVSSTNNGTAGLQNMMDVAGITMAGNDDTQMVVTLRGMEIAPNLANFLTDRPLHLASLGGEWLVEEVLAQNTDGTLADPVIVRDLDRGRLIPMFQANSQNDPKGAVAAEVVAFLFDAAFTATRIDVSGSGTTVTETPLELLVRLEDGGGLPIASATAVTVSLTTDSATGAFDAAWNGSFDGTLTSATIPAGDAGETYVRLFYRDASPGAVTLSAIPAGAPELDDGVLQVEVLEDLSGAAGRVAIWTGTTNWISKAAADAQAQICVDALADAGIAVEWLADAAAETELADWVSSATDNGAVDVLVLYGYFPSSLYPAGNAMPDGSIAELFIESTDGDVIINHADWMFYVSSTNNGTAGLQNMMDIPGVTMAGYDNLQMTVTDVGMAIAPSLADFLTDRPLHLETLEGEWFVEASLARNAGGTLADPVIVRDGNRGRLIPVHQAADQDDPKGAVAAEIISWLLGASPAGMGPFVRGNCNDDAKVDLSDAVCVLNWLFGGAATPACVAAADSNGDGATNITDATYLLNALFSGGPAPVEPYPECGLGMLPSDAELGCVSPPACQ